MKPIRDITDDVLYRLSRLQLFGRLPNNFDRENRRLVLQSVIIGAVVWAPVFLLKLLVHTTFDQIIEWLVRAPIYLVFAPLLMGAAIVAFIASRKSTTILYRDSDGQTHELNDVEGDGMERAISLYYASEPSFEHALLGKEGVDVRWELPTVSLVWRKFIASWATLGSGGSGGLEGSVALIGESLAASMFKPRRPLVNVGRRHSWLNRPLRWWSIGKVDQLQTAQLSGIAAAVATLTGAPFMSAFFAAEVMYRRRPLIEKLIYSLISTLVAYFLSIIVRSGHDSLFAVEQLYLPPSDLQYYGLILLMAVCVSLFSIYFVRLRRLADRVFQRSGLNIWAQHMLGASLTAIVALIVVVIAEKSGVVGRAAAFDLVLSTGDRTIETALAGNLTLTVALIALIGKSLTTVLTIGSGGSAGMLIPSLFLGTMVAAILASIFNYEPMLLIVPAMTASLVSIVNVPLAAIMLPIELFSSHYLPAALLSLLVCVLLTADNKIYRSQRETFSKRQILPGAEVRRVMVPVDWEQKTLVDLDFRRAFNLTVIGLLETVTGDGKSHVRLDPAASMVLRAGDTIVVLGSGEDLDRLENHIIELETARMEAELNGESSPHSPA